MIPLWLLVLLILACAVGTGVTVYVVRTRRAATQRLRAVITSAPSERTPVTDTHFERESLGGRRYRHTQYLRPIGYQRDGGVWHITSQLAGSGDPALPIGCDELLQFRIRDRLSGNAPVLHVGHGGDYLRMTPLDTANVIGIVAGNAITFPGAWSAADLVYTLGGHLIRETITLKAGHPGTFRFRIDEHTGLDPVALTVGRLRILQPTLEPPAGNASLSIPLTWLVTQQGGKWVLSVTLPPGDWAGWMVDPTLTLQPGAADGKDTHCRNDYPTWNYGIQTIITIAFTVNAPALVTFNVSSLPASALCTSAMLYLYHATPGTASAWTAQIYSVAVGNADWPEGTKNGAIGGVGDCCYNYKEQTPGSETGWAGSAGLNTSGVDYEASVIGSFSGNRTDALGTEYTTTLTANRVQGWFGVVNTNYGLLLRSSGGNDSGMCSSDHATAAYRPKLVIVYTLPGSSKLGLLHNGIQYAQGF